MLGATTLRLPTRSGGFASPAILRAASRRPTRTRPDAFGSRFQSTLGGGSPSSSSSHVFSGLAGGAVVVLGGYTIYYFSDLRKTVQTAKTAKDYLKQAQDQITTTVSQQFSSSSDSSKAKKANEIVRYLRGVARSYVGMIPGAGSYVDTTFDSLDKIVAEHSEEATDITQKAYDDIQKIVNENSGKNGGDLTKTGPDVAFKVLEVLRKSTAELYELGKKAGGHAVDEVLEKNPQLKEKLGGGYEQLKSLVESGGPEAKKALDDVTSQIMAVASQGPNADNLTDLSKLIREKVDQVRKISEPIAQQAWDKAISSVSPYLDKVPDIRKALDDQKSAFLSLGASALSVGQGQKNDITEIMDQVKEVSGMKDGKERKEKVQKLKEYISQKAQEAQKKAESTIGDGLSWDAIEGYVKLLPGGSEMLEKAPNARAFIDLSKDKGEEATKLAKETWEDIFKVLEDKGKKARELAQSTKEEGKKKAATN